MDVDPRTLFGGWREPCAACGQRRPTQGRFCSDECERGYKVRALLSPPRKFHLMHAHETFLDIVQIEIGSDPMDEVDPGDPDWPIIAAFMGPARRSFVALEDGQPVEISEKMRNNIWTLVLAQHPVPTEMRVKVFAKPLTIVDHKTGASKPAVEYVVSLPRRRRP